MVFRVFWWNFWKLGSFLVIRVRVTWQMFLITFMIKTAARPSDTIRDILRCSGLRNLFPKANMRYFDRSVTDGLIKRHSSYFYVKAEVAKSDSNLSDPHLPAAEWTQPSYWEVFDAVKSRSNSEWGFPVGQRAAALWSNCPELAVPEGASGKVLKFVSP